VASWLQEIFLFSSSLLLSSFFFFFFSLLSVVLSIRLVSRVMLKRNGIRVPALPIDKRASKVGLFLIVKIHHPSV